MSATTRTTRALLAFAAAILTACGSDADPATGPTPNPIPVETPVASVTVSGSTTRLVVGENTTLVAQPRDAAGRALNNRALTWSSSDIPLAHVSANGVVTAVAPGTVSIRATSGTAHGEYALTIVPRTALVASITLDVTSLQMNKGERRVITATPRDSTGQPIPGLDVSWAVTGGNPAATVSVAGVITALEKGIVTINASLNGKLAQATLTVIGDATHDLLFDQWEADAAGIQRSWLHRLDQRLPDATPARLLSGAGASDATPSPDGLKVAFTCTTGHGTAICLANRDGSGVVQLPGMGEPFGLRADQPSWNSDGTRIAFRGWAPGGDPGIFNPADIYVMNADGSNRVRITSGAKNVESFATPTWSPRLVDGSERVAFSHVTRGTDGYMYANIESARADGTSRRVITPASVTVDETPSWSPDGNSIAFVRTGGEVAGDIWLVDALGGNARALMPASLDPSGAQRAPAWSPDGTQIAFASNHEIILTWYNWQIYTVRADGTQLVRHTSDRAEKGNPAWLRRP